MERHARIRLHIMLIAFIGGLAFLLYLLVNVLLAMDNARRLDRLQHHHYPILEEIRLLQRDLDSLRESLATAVGLADPELLEDAGRLADQVRRRLQYLHARDAQLREEAEGLQSAFEIYARPAFLLAQGLVAEPHRLPEYKAALEALLRDYEELTGWVNALDATRQAEYQALLNDTHAAAQRANGWGALLGVVVILLLLLLAWIIANRVLREITRGDRLKDEFLGAISHELRTPMNGVVGALSLLRTTALNEEQQSWLELARRSASGMLMSIDDLLQFSELAAGREALHLGEFRLRTGLVRLLETLQPEFTEQRLPLEFYGEPVLDRVILSHEAKILYVIRQLLANALKYAGAGPVSLSVTQVKAETGPAGGVLCVRVRDAGPGIPDEFLRELGRPFLQQDGSFSRRQGGLGIGLASCQVIARQLQGQLQLRNRPGGGLEAEFTFPVRWGEASPSLPVPAPGQRHRSGLVLLVDDNLVSLLVLKGYLKHLGYRAVTARNGYQALDLMQSRLVDLVLLDSRMPLLDGLETARRIRLLPAPLNATPIIALSGQAADTAQLSTPSSGIDGVLKKPVALEELREVLSRHLGATVPVPS